MPMGPLEIQDVVTLDLSHKIAESQRKLNLFGTKSDTSVCTELCETLADKYDRHGRSTGGGYYDYPKEGGKVVWPKLYELFHKPELAMSNEDVKDRFLFRQAIETVKCLQEGVLPSVADGNIGSSLGIGAPAWTGGWLQVINTFEGKGVKAFAERAAELAEKYGERFEPPTLLLEKANKNELFT
jgi:3-hydroxyacyl-CoA dehydrogenase/enoyl-CoA hydratase/3-hydroxybutyryl-CoA epimerase